MSFAQYYAWLISVSWFSEPAIFSANFRSSYYYLLFFFAQLIIRLILMLLLSTHSSLFVGNSPFLLLYGVSPPASPTSHLVGLLRRRDPSQIQGRQRGVYLWATEVVWYVCQCDKGGRVVMGVFKHQFFVDVIGGKGIYLFLVGLVYDACAGVSSLQCC